jgi:iron complex outermembrane receptor protein
VGVRSTLNYKACFTVPFEMSIGTEMAFDSYRFHYFETYTFLSNQGSVKAMNLVLKAK